MRANDFTGPGMQGAKQGLYQLEDVDLFNLLVIPPLAPDVDVPDALWTDALSYCQGRRAMLIIDPPSSWNRPDQAITGIRRDGESARGQFGHLLSRASVPPTRSGTICSGPSRPAACWRD